MAQRKISVKEKAEKGLAGERGYLDEIINAIGDPVFVKDASHRLILVNDSECALIGRMRDEIIGKTDYDFFPKKQVDVFWKKDEELLATGKENVNEEEITDAQGRKRIVITKKTLYKDKKGNKFIVGVIRDITERKASEDLMRISIALLEEQKKLLEEKNIAFQELIKGIEVEKNDIKDNVALNIDELVLPIIRKLRLKGSSRRYTGILEKNLETLTSSFGRKMANISFKLTPREIEICNMIREGLMTKEIAGILSISRQTIDKHRKNIRHKLKVSKKHINLTSFLKSL
jgi:PAS domain S-box-containing protein